MDSLAHIPKRREAVDCFNCSASLRSCDRTRHRCETCSQGAEICQGYPRELQWLTGVTSRGKQKGRSLSIKPSSHGWASTTPINHNFVFKPGRPQKTNKQGSKSPRTRSIHKAACRQARVVVDSGVEQSQQVLVDIAESEASPVSPEDPCAGSALDAIEICDPDPFTAAEDIFDDLDSSFAQNFCSNEDTMFLLPPQLDSPWQIDSSVPLMLENEPRIITSPPISSLTTLGPAQLLTFYNSELCALPLTFDFHANPFRCKTDGPLHLIHALLAISIQHLSRMNDVPQEDVFAQQVVSYKQSATDLCSAALQVSPERSKKSMLDSILVLFALDTLISSVGPWNARLVDAHQKIESLGGINAVVSSPRSRARVGMFVWWDCIIALLSRSESVFPAAYFDFALSCDGDLSFDVHALSGVPKELFQYFRELIELASEKEQISKMRYARFDTERVLELEQCIQAYTVGEYSAQNVTDTLLDEEEMIHSWHDFCNASNAWKYALLLYISRVLKWDRNSDTRLPEITSLSRLLLDSVRSCRSVASLPKQLLFPVFLAGSESTDPYSRKFVKEYCEEWYRNSRYTMFMDALGLLEEIWAQKDLKRNDFRVWWGGVLGDRQPHGSGFLFG